MSVPTPLARLEYHSPTVTRHRWFAWRPFWISLLLVLLALGCWRSLPHILRVQDAIGAENHVGQFQALLSLRRQALVPMACGPVLIGMLWALGDHAAGLRWLRRPLVWTGISLPIVAIAAMGYFTFEPLLAFDRQLSVPFPHSSATLPMHFNDTRSLYTYLAYLSGVNTNSSAVADFIAGCVIERFPEGVEGTWVIAPTFDAGGHCYYRGASGNGDYYIVRPILANDGVTSNGFDLTGIAAGNTYKFSTANGHGELDTWWHISVAEHEHTRYVWDKGAWRISR